MKIMSEKAMDRKARRRVHRKISNPTTHVARVKQLSDGKYRYSVKHDYPGKPGIALLYQLRGRRLFAMKKT